MRWPGREHWSVAIMKPSLCFVFLCVLGTVVAQRHLDHQVNEVSSVHEAAIESERKLILECQNTDYRAYIKCLKREKRQHRGTGFGNTRACLDECFEQNCTNLTCLRDCHSHCRKRLIETYSKTVETSYDCADGECTETRGSNTPNITTIVNITNLLPNTTNCVDRSEQTNNEKPCQQSDTKCSQGEAKCGHSNSKCGHDNSRCGQDVRDSNEDKRKTELTPKIDINNIINNQFGTGFYPGADCGCPGCNCYPYNPWQSSPQITIGIGGGPIGGCMYPISWPCFQRFPTPSIDCSICNNPFLRYRCDPACGPDPRKNSTLTTTEKTITSTQWLAKSKKP